MVSKTSTARILATHLQRGVVGGRGLRSLVHRRRSCINSSSSSSTHIPSTQQLRPHLPRRWTRHHLCIGRPRGSSQPPSMTRYSARLARHLPSRPRMSTVFCPTGNVYVHSSNNRCRRRRLRLRLLPPPPPPPPLLKCRLLQLQVLQLLEPIWYLLFF